MPFDFGLGYDPTLIDTPPGSNISGGLGLDSPASTPAPSTAPGIDLDWKTLLALAVEGAAAGYQGKTPQGPGILMREREMQRQKEKEDQALNISRHEAVLHTLKSMKEYADLIGGDEKKADKVAAFLQPSLETVTQGKFKADDIKEMLIQPDGIDALIRYYPEVQKAGGIDPQTRTLMRQGKITMKDLSERAKTALGERAFQSAIALREGDAINADVSLPQLNQLLPDSQYLSDEQKLQLNQAGYKNITSKAVMEAAAKDEPAQRRFDQREERMAKEAQDREQRFNETQNRLERSMAQAQARFEQSQSAIDKRHMETLQAALQRPLEQGDREAVAAMEENLNVARRLKTEFTDEERKKFVGVIQNPTARAMQLVKNDPKFAKFQTLTNEVKGFAFAEGGKQLTGTEKQIVWGHLPTGTEFSVNDYVSNLDRTLERTESLIRRRIELATTPRNRITTPANNTAPAGGGWSIRPK